MTNFSNIADAVFDLTVDEQEALIEILQRRIAQQHYESLRNDPTSASDEFGCRSGLGRSIKELMQELRSKS